MIHMNFVQIAEFDWLPWQNKARVNFSKKKFKNFLLRSCNGDEAETLHTCS